MINQKLRETRRIFKSEATSPSVLKELFEMLFLAELVNPGSEAWLVSPWISDIPVIDNGSGSFDAINSDWPRKEIRLSTIVSELTSAGCQVKIVTRDNAQGKSFERKLIEICREQGDANKIAFKYRDVLHTKGILTSHGFLAGSMNLSFNGLIILDEQIELDTQEDQRAQARIEFHERYGE